ncbi:MAG: hypothetical protein ACRCWC_18495, partial [Plesiomonas shigelloides]
MQVTPITVNILNERLEKHVAISFNRPGDKARVFPIDSILDFQKKISAISGIEFYKQCLCLEWTPITHGATLHNKVINIDVRDILRDSNRISNINIDIMFYENKSDITITSAISTLIRDVVTKPCEFNLVVMDSFI